MSDYHNAYIVVLKRDIKDEDAKRTITALHQIKGVVGVTPHVVEVGDAIAQMRVDSDWRQRLIEFAFPNRKEA